jgi:hypothetical protein
MADFSRQVVATGDVDETDAGAADLDKSECEVRQVQSKVLTGRGEEGGHV